jgi:hypothetical protein
LGSTRILTIQMELSRKQLLYKVLSYDSNVVTGPISHHLFRLLPSTY